MTCLLDRARGTASRIVFQSEPCWGTPDLSGAQRPRGIDPIPGETMRNSINRIESQIIRSDRMRPAPQQGNQRPGGEIPGEFQPQTWPTILRMALCQIADVTTVGSGPYTHTFNGEVNLDDGITIEKRFTFREADPVVLQYRGSRTNTFALNVPLEGIIGCRAGFVSKREKEVFPGSLITDDKSIEDIAPAYYFPDNEPFNSFHCAIEVDNVPIAVVKSVDTLTINNNMELEGFALNGTPYRADISEGDRAINGNGIMFFTRDTYDQFYPAFINNETLSFRITFERGTRSVSIFLPAIKISGEITPTLAVKGPLDIPFNFDAFRDDDSGTDIQVTVVNDDPSLDTAA